MAIFNSSCAPWGVNDGITTIVQPDVDPPSVSGSIYLSRGERLRATVANGKTRRRQLTRRKSVFRSECFKQFGDLFWFGHVHIIPRGFALGNVLSTIEREYEIYNAFRETPKQISAINKQGVEGFTLSGEPDASPNVLQPLTGAVVTVSVSPVGPVTVSATITYTFVTGEVLQVTFSGTRVVVASLEPEGNVTEVAEFFTDVITHESGNEQRIAARDVPRQSYTYRFVKTDEEMAFLENQLWGWAENTWALPIWNDYTVLTEDIAAGTTTVPVQTTADRDFRANVLGGEIALIWSDKDTFEAFEVESFGADSLTARQGLLANFSEGDLVMPLRLAVIRGAMGGRYEKVNAKAREVTWHILNNVRYVQSPEFSDFADTYRSLPVWDIVNDPLIVNGGRYTVNDNKGLIPFDDALGKNSVFSTRKYPLNSLSSFIHNSYGRSDFVRMRRRFQALKGRQKAFWVSTGRKDFEIESETTNPSLDINILPVNYTNQVFSVENGPKTRQDIEIVYVDGTVDRRRITGSQLTAGVREVLTLDSSISQTVSAANVERISYLVKRRLASDRVSFNHESYEGEVDAAFGLVDVFDE